MSDRPLIAPNSDKPFVNAASMATNVTSPASIIQRLPGIAYDIQWTGTPTGTFAIEVSNTYSQNADGSVRNAGSWSTIPSASFSGTYPVPSGNAGTGFIDVVGTQAYAVRIVYVAGSSTGSLTIVPCSKVW
jgi:hypothetical protein